MGVRSGLQYRSKKSRNDRVETKFVPSVAGYTLYDHGTNEEV
jgi:hypothetical protein